MNCKHKFAAIAAIALTCIAPALRADEAAKIQRQIVLKDDLGIAGHEGVMARVEIPPGVAEGYHTHPADVFAFILEGEVMQEVAGKPTVTLKAGDVFHVPAGAVHQATNKGSVPAKIAVVFVAEKGKPLTTPVK
ncbi:MAG: cupin domain-containing protein [Proteobacteria bacterium]|uniref:cupin domain-containing protein n=1 Tax=Rudaea sp. TaxID=2136325 RepID=UPI0032200130|nr:cupin domain-containing protein [Pseudomonadota bacterium]